LKRDWIDYFVFFIILLILFGIFYLKTKANTAPEVREIAVEGFEIKLPPGFHQLSKQEKKAYGFAERIVVLSKGDMGHLILIDVEKGIPEKLKSEDINDYYLITLEELKKNVNSFRLISKKRTDWGFEIIYTGEIKKSVFKAAYLSFVYPGKKLNLSVSVPQEEEKQLEYYLEILREGIKFD
jgi:hypothetical protein